MLFELIDLAAIKGPVTGIVNPRRDLIDQETAIGQLEHFNAHNADIVQTGEDSGRQGHGQILGLC